MLALLNVETKGAAEEKGGGLEEEGGGHNAFWHAAMPIMVVHIALRPLHQRLFFPISSTTKFSTHKSVFQSILFQRCIDHFVF